MSQLPAISDAEWEVMTVLWDKSPLSASEIVSAFQGRKAWSPRTIKTLLNRLVKKHALDFSTQGNRYLYRPRVSRDACVLKRSRSFLDRVFGSAAGPMILQFVRQTDLSPIEIEQLQEILRTKSKEK